MMDTGSVVPMPAALADKYRRLVEMLRERPCALAFSGGVDSAFLLRAMCDARREPLALIAVTCFQTQTELAAARALARSLGARLAEIAVDVLALETVAANPPDRCYFCKRALFERLIQHARESGYERVAEGTHTDDLGAYRPGRRALAELGVWSPLVEAGFSKADIRACSRALGLPTADQPSRSCLATRVPTGTPLRADVIERIARAEQAVEALGFHELRVRDHGDIARLEVPARDIERAAACAAQLAEAICAQGYRFAALDLAGYRTGSVGAENMPGYQHNP